MQELSTKQVQKIVVLAQKLQLNSKSSKGLKGTLQSVNHMGYVQIDSISVVARAHHHTMYNRVKNYKEDYLGQLLKSREIFEYWSHAAAFLPISAFKYSLPRKHALKSGEQHWFKKDKKVMKLVLDQITDQGPAMAKDFANSKKSSDGWWDWKPAKIALEQLYMQGDLMVSERRGFHKVYDLTSRVFPESADIVAPSAQEYCQHLVLHYLQANGVAKLEHFGYLLKGLKVSIKQQLNKLEEQGLITQVTIKNELYYVPANVIDLLTQKISHKQVKILSPFDNLLIQRKRMSALFDFNYQIECYVPAAKRKYGYFSLPILQGLNFVGRMDVKVHRKDQRMAIQHLHLHTDKLDYLEEPLANSILEFKQFQQANEVNIDRVTSDFSTESTKKLKTFKLGLMQKIADVCLS